MIQFSEAVSNARLDAVQIEIGASATLKIWEGIIPANCAAADNGTVLATVLLPYVWMVPASGGNKSKSGTWQQSYAASSGEAGYFRIYDSTGLVCGMQGTVGIRDSDMIVDTTEFEAGEDFTIIGFTLTDGNL